MTPTERQQVVDAAWAEVVATQGPIPTESTNAIHAWFQAHRSDFRAAYARLAAGEPAPPTQPDLFAGAT